MTLCSYKICHDDSHPKLFIQQANNDNDGLVPMFTRPPGHSIYPYLKQDPEWKYSSRKLGGCQLSEEVGILPTSTIHEYWVCACTLHANIYNMYYTKMTSINLIYHLFLRILDYQFMCAEIVFIYVKSFTWPSPRSTIRVPARQENMHTAILILCCSFFQGKIIFSSHCRV